MPTRPQDITSFSLEAGRVIGGKYVVESLLGGGWEGEVYRVVERRTGALRAAKLFFPIRNAEDRAVAFYARKLEQLRDCPVVIKYHHSETMRYRGVPITVLISEYVEGRILEDLVNARRGKRLPEFEALGILYRLVVGLEQIHARRDYHGDLHSGNILVQRRGVHFDVKLVDLYDLGRPSAAKAREDIIDAVRIFYDMLGGQPRYREQRPEFKHIVCGLKRSMITKRFPTARQLREHLDSFEWASDRRG
jgi:serine/threonine protein kinase